MFRTFTSICFSLLLLGAAYGQVSRSPGEIFPGYSNLGDEKNVSRNVLDTVFYPVYGDECDLEKVTIGIQQGWGRISGMNFFGDLEKAQRLEFNATENFTVVGALVYFEKPAIVGNGAVNCKIYSVHPATGAPFAIKGFSNAVKMTEIIKPESVPVATPFSFEDGVEVNLTEPQFFVSVDFSNLYASRDTLVILQSIPECGDGNNTWELHNDGVSWYPISSSFSWELNSDFLIAAVVDFSDPTSTDDYIKIEDFMLHPAFPNPSANSITLNYSLKRKVSLKIQIYNQSGMFISGFDEVDGNPGRHSFEIDISQYSAGNYYYRIISNEGSITSRFTVLR